MLLKSIIAKGEEHVFAGGIYTGRSAMELKCSNMGYCPKV